MFIYKIGTDQFHRQIAEHITSQLPENKNIHVDMSKIMFPLKQLQYQMTAVMVIVFLLVCIALFVFIHSLEKPLNDVARVAKKMTDGHLNETVPIHSQDEIGKIGELINDLGVNLQEVLLHVWQYTTHSITLLDQIRTSVSAEECDCIPGQLEEDLELIRQNIEDMQALVQTFELYDIRLEQDKVMAGEQTGVES